MPCELYLNGCYLSKLAKDDSRELLSKGQEGSSITRVCPDNLFSRETTFLVQLPDGTSTTSTVLETEGCLDYDHNPSLN